MTERPTGQVPPVGGSFLVRESFAATERPTSQHAIIDVSPDTGGHWWVACTCDWGQGGHFDELAARHAGADHLAQSDQEPR